MTKIAKLPISDLLFFKVSYKYMSVSILLDI